MPAINLADYVLPSSRDGKKRWQWQDACAFLDSPAFQDIVASADSGVTLSLEGFDFLNVDGLVWLLLTGEHLRDRGKSMTLELPTNAEQLRQIKSSHFQPLMQDVFSVRNLFMLDGIQLPKDSDLFRFWKVDLGSLRDIQDHTYLLLFHQISKNLGIDPMTQLGVEFVQPFITVIRETARNIVEHSRDHPGGGWGYCVLAPRPFRHGMRLVVTLGDCGVGFRRSLKAKGIHARNDADAVRHAILYRCDSRLGEGLVKVVQLASQLQGVLRIRSGQASAFLDCKGTQLSTDDAVRQYVVQNLRLSTRGHPFPGVQWYVDLTSRNNAH